MSLLALSFSSQTTIRLEELSALLAAVAGAALFFGATMPLGRRGGQLLGGLCLAVAGVLAILALHWGS